MEKNRKAPPSYEPEETSIDRIESSTPKSVTYRKMENTSASDILKNYTGGFSWDADSQDYFNYPYFSYLYANESDFYNVSSTNSEIEKKLSCQWETAQHSLFQFSNMCFLTAFVIPRNYKSGILLFRILLCISFILSAIWAGVHFCAVDWFIWSSGLAVTNGVHVIVLTFKFLPPALSLELTELYIRMFKPLKVSKKHFKELTKEACLLRLAPGETYAVEEVTAADEKLSILLKGRIKVSCSGTFLHTISSYQFIDSPEWQANTSANGARFQVTITAEEDCLCLTWCRLKLDRVLRHRPQVKFILNNLIGKDITHKMYSLNEQVGQMCTTEAMSRAVREDHWRRSMNRSVSVDAVDTSTRGHVRSTAWKTAEKYRKNSTHSENEAPLLGQQQCWYPLVASQFPTEYPFVMPDESVESQDDEREPMLSKSTQRNPEVDVSQLQQIQKQQLQMLSQYSKLDANAAPLSLLNLGGNAMLNSQPIALIPVIVPVIPSSVSTSISNTVATVSSSSASRAASLKRQRGVKFDETHL